MIKQILFSLLLFILFISCSDNIKNNKYRNADYLFYEEDGKKGYWQKINSASTFKYKKGKLTYFYDNSNLFSEIEVIDSFPNRVVKYYNQNEKLIKTYWIKNDSMIKEHLENGYFKHNYSPDGPVIQEGLVENNLRQGIWKFYRSEDGSLIRVTEMKDNFAHGKSENYWKNGNRKNIAYWNKGKESGQGIAFYENGKIEEKHFIKDGKIHGRVEQFYPNGSKRYWANSWYGIVKDTSKYYYQNGILQELNLVSLDTITKISIGKVYNYFPNGKLKAESEIKNDLLYGISITYHENGKKKEWMELRNNKLNGKYIQYYESGEKKQELKAKDKYLTDNIYFFDKNGTITKTLIAEKGVIIDSIIK
jgi:antitoxin component YwqK of YwqJK toxin-antitoxin module